MTLGPNGRRHQLRTLALLCGPLLGALIVIAGHYYGFIGWYYPRIVENKSLLSPIVVTSIDETTITLQDGRVLTVIPCFSSGFGPLQAAVARSGYEIDVEPTEDGFPHFAVYVSEANDFVCTTPWYASRPAINIPLIPYSFNRNHRTQIAFARIAE